METNFGVRTRPIRWLYLATRRDVLARHACRGAGTRRRRTPSAQSSLGKHAFTLAGGIYTSNCGACEPECPVEAIFPEDALPAEVGAVREDQLRLRGRRRRDQQARRRVRRPSTTSRTRRSSQLRNSGTGTGWLCWPREAGDARPRRPLGGGPRRHCGRSDRAGRHARDRSHDAFTLVGSDARRGKLTLFAAEGPRERGALKHVALRVSSNEQAEERVGEGSRSSGHATGELYFDVHEGLRIGLVEAPTEVEYDIDHVALWSSAPEETAKAYLGLGFSAGRARAVRRAARRGGRRVRRVPPGRAGRSRAAAARTTWRSRSTRPTTTSPRRASSGSRSRTSWTPRTRTRCSSGGPSASRSSTSSTSPRSR